MIPHTLPPKPKLKVEREAFLNNLRNVLLDENPSRIAILGEEGFGKTTCSLFALHDPLIARRFTQRFYLSCEGMTNARSLLVGIAHMLGIQSNKSRTTFIPSIKQSLQGTTTLICLDDFESPWEELSTRAKVEDVLASISAIENVSLVVNVKGKERPISVDWTWPPLSPLQPISLSGVDSIFRDITGIQAVDQYTRNLLQSVEGIPLAITLISDLLRNGTETSSSLWKRWSYEEQAQNLIMDTALDDRRAQISKIDVAISVSIGSLQVQRYTEARNILAMLSLLPDGFSLDDTHLLELQTLLKANNLHKCLDTLQNLGLLQIDEALVPPRIRVTRPIGNYCRKSLVSEISAVCVELTNYYVNKMTEIGAPTTAPNTEHHAEMQKEIRNIYSLFQRRFTSQNIVDITLAKFVRASYLLGLWSIHMGYMLDDIFQLAFGSSAMLPTYHARHPFDQSSTYCEMGPFEDVQEISALTSALISRTWPPFFMPITSPHDAGLLDARTALLTAALGFSFARMATQEVLTLPESDAALVAHHSALGLQVLTRMAGKAETGALYAWLAGQMNDVHLRLPNPVDGRLTGVPRRVRSSPQPFRAGAARRLSVLSSRVGPFSAFGGQPDEATTPASTLLLTPPFFSAASPSILPVSTAPPKANSSHPLGSLTVNLTTTLYAGLRPATLMATLRGGPTHLTLRIARLVDRRTIEKVVAVVGATLGSREDSAGGADGNTEGDKEGLAFAVGEKWIVPKKKAWQGTGTLPFTMPIRPNAAEYPSVTMITSAKRRGMVARGAVVRDEEDEEDPDYVKLAPAPADLRSRMVNRSPKNIIVARMSPAHGKAPHSDKALATESDLKKVANTAIKSAQSQKPMVARSPLVRDEDEDELEVTSPSPITENSKTRTISTATKSRMVARGPVIREEDDNEEPGIVKLQPEPLELWVRTVRTATQGMIPRSPVIREEEEDSPVEEKFTSAAAEAQNLTSNKRNLSTKPMVARAPLVHDEDEDDGVLNDVREPSVATGALSRMARADAAPARNVRNASVKLMIARQPIVRDEDEDEEESATPSPLASTFKSGAGSISSQSSFHSSYGRSAAGKLMVARTTLAHDEDEEQDTPLEERKISSTTETFKIGATSVQSVSRKSMVEYAPSARDQARDVTKELREFEFVPVVEDLQERTVNTTRNSGAFRQHGRHLSAKLKAMIARVPRTQEDTAALAHSVPEGAAGPQWEGLVLLEIAFDYLGSDNSGREEVSFILKMPHI